MSGGPNQRLSLLTHVVTGCVGIVLGAVVVLLHGQGSPTGEPRPSIQMDTAALELDIRRVVREELTRHGNLVAAAGHSTAAAPTTPVVVPPAAPAVVSPEVVAQAARADAVLAGAAARLVWTDEDAREFRSAIAGLPPAERQEILLKFAQAVNDRGMRLETGGAPF
jgi:hypothetical protein